MQVLVDACKRGLDSIGVSFNRKQSGGRLCEEWRHTVCKFRSAASTEIMIEDRMASRV